MPVSGRAGLFTINVFNPNITDDTHTTTRGQKSGALRLEFGKVRVTDASTTMTSAKTTINTGIMAVVTPSRVPSPVTLTPTHLQSGGALVSGIIYTSGLYLTTGTFGVFASGSFLSGVFNVQVTATGSFSGQASGMDINYMVVGY